MPDPSHSLTEPLLQETGLHGACSLRKVVTLLSLLICLGVAVLLSAVPWHHNVGAQPMGIQEPAVTLALHHMQPAKAHQLPQMARTWWYAQPARAWQSMQSSTPKQFMRPIGAESDDNAVAPDSKSEDAATGAASQPKCPAYPDCGCDGEGRIQGGLATFPLLGWWPIKLYRPCSKYLEAGFQYVRKGQILDEIKGGKLPKKDADSG